MTTVNLATMTDEEIATWADGLALPALQDHVDAYRDVHAVPALARYYDLLIAAWQRREVLVRVNGHEARMTLAEWEVAKLGVPMRATVAVEEVVR